VSALHPADPQPFRDGLIAATALVRNLVVVTRNPADFFPGERGETAESLAAALLLLGRRVQPQGSWSALRQRSHHTLTTRNPWLLETAVAGRGG